MFQILILHITFLRNVFKKENYLKFDSNLRTDPTYFVKIYFHPPIRSYGSFWNELHSGN